MNTDLLSALFCTLVGTTFLSVFISWGFTPHGYVAAFGAFAAYLFGIASLEAGAEYFNAIGEE